MTAGAERSIDPPITQASEPYWDATRNGQLRFQWCNQCSIWMHYPRPRCTKCLGADLSYRDPGSDFRLYSWALHSAVGASAPRMVALVQISDGLRILTNVIDETGTFDGLDVDIALSLDWQPLGDGRNLPVFRTHPSHLEYS